MQCLKRLLCGSSRKRSRGVDGKLLAGVLSLVSRGSSLRACPAPLESLLGRSGRGLCEVGRAFALQLYLGLLVLPFRVLISRGSILALILAGTQLRTNLVRSGFWLH
jgi:hypothetical protein